MTGFVTVMPYEGNYAVVVAPSQPTEPGAKAILPTTIVLSRDGLLGLVHEAEKALVVQEGEEATTGYQTVCFAMGREEELFPAWHWLDVLDMVRDAWGMSRDELPTEALQSAIVVPSDLVLDAKGESASDRDHAPPSVFEVGLVVPVDTEGTPCP